MADALSLRRQQYVSHWLTGPAAFRPLRAGAAASTAGPVAPVPDKYAFQTIDRQTNKRKTKKRTSPMRKVPAFAAGFYNRTLPVATIRVIASWSPILGALQNARHYRYLKQVWRVYGVTPAASRNFTGGGSFSRGRKYLGHPWCGRSRAVTGDRQTNEQMDSIIALIPAFALGA